MIKVKKFFEKYIQTKKILLISLIILGLLSPVHSKALESTTSDYVSYITRSVLPSGAIAKYPIGMPVVNEIVPYWSNLAICGLASEIKFGTNESQKLDLYNKSINALNWYKDKQDPVTGIVYDYTVADNQEVSKGTMDSVDSYSASYLLAISCIHKSSPEFGNLLQTYQNSIRLAIKSIRNLQDRDGLTFAKPGYDIKYLMDNVEVWAGLDAIMPVLVALKDRNLLFNARITNTRLQFFINKKLWDETDGSYKWAVAKSSEGKDVFSKTDWAVYYPDALENIWPGAFGYKQPMSRSVQLAQKFLTTTYRDNGIANGNWNPFVGIAYYNANLNNDANQSYQYTKELLNSQKLSGLYTTGHAGMSIVLHYKIKNQKSLSI